MSESPDSHSDQVETGFMKGSVLTRPNLKLFVLGGLILLAVQDLVTSGHSQNTIVHARHRSQDRVSEATLQKWLTEASQTTSPDVCMRLSDEYYRRGQIKRALFFLRLAEQLGEAEQ